jgi:hypothetical protein
MRRLRAAHPTILFSTSAKNNKALICSTDQGQRNTFENW